MFLPHSDVNLCSYHMVMLMSLNEEGGDKRKKKMKKPHQQLDSHYPKVFSKYSYKLRAVKLSQWLRAIAALTEK